MQDAISLFSSFLLSGLQQYGDVDHYHQFLITPSNYAHRTTMSSTSCILLSSIFFSTAYLFIVISSHQCYMISETLPKPKNYSNYPSTRCIFVDYGFRWFQNYCCCFQCLLKSAVTQELSLFHYKILRTTDNQEFDLHNSNVFILNCDNFSERYHFKKQVALS
jgi:hypothetical protein